jgi:hypothetical protein
LPNGRSVLKINDRLINSSRSTKWYQFQLFLKKEIKFFITLGRNLLCRNIFLFKFHKPLKKLFLLSLGIQCPKADCMYLHDLGEDNASFTKEQMSQGKHLEYESRLIESVLHIPRNLQNISNDQTNQIIINQIHQGLPSALLSHKSNKTTHSQGNNTTSSHESSSSESQTPTSASSSSSTPSSSSSSTSNITNAESAPATSSNNKTTTSSSHNSNSNGNTSNTAASGANSNGLDKNDAKSR